MRMLPLTLVLAAASFDAAAACDTAESRQFDFWLGHWEVVKNDPTAESAEVIGTNTITRIAGGCGLEESWVARSGTSGRSLNAYDSGRKRWRQFWIGSDGGILELEGGMVGTAMVMEGAVPGDPHPQLQRITWTPHEEGLVQRWEQSDDQGASWKTVFDGRYRRVGAR